ncbi:FecR domain-containing protein [soil metagenome]
MIAWSKAARTRRIEKRAYRWLMEMLDDPTRHAAALERWLSKDPEHRAVYRRVSGEVGRASDAAVEMPTLRASYPARPRKRVWNRPAILLASAGLATACFALIVVATSLFGKDRSVLATAERVPSQSIVSGATGKSVRLSDGSNVAMFGSGRLTVEFTQNERSVRLLGGSARFSVAHDQARPFVVYAGGGSVTAVGTIFEVSLNRQVEVRLISGVVNVAFPRRATAENRPVTIRAGQHVTYQQEPLSFTQAEPSPTSQNSSIRRVESFDDVPVSTIVARVNSGPGAKIVLLDGSIGQEKIFADIDVGDPAAVARKLATILRLSIDSSLPNEIRLSRIN